MDLNMSSPLRDLERAVNGECAEVEARLGVEIRGTAVLQDPLECTSALHHPAGPSHCVRLTARRVSRDVDNAGQHAG